MRGIFLSLSQKHQKGETTIAKADRCVVRNQAYRRGEFSIRERHNERKNVCYANGDIVKERSPLNIFFKSCPGTYEQEFSRMVEDGAISLRGLKADAKVFDELVFDVNSAYFENHGGYDYAREFFAEAYRLAVKEAGGEQYILSAVLHADERNKALSDQLDRDVFHYHLHVVYVPVVDKEIKWTKRCKDPALVGTVKEVIKQVSHSKKWPRFKDEKGAWVNSYSLLQDRFFEHMRAAGFTDFERGERGSTAEHLSVLDYKIRQDEARAAVLDEAIADMETTAAMLDKRVETKERQLTAVTGKLAVSKQTAATFSEIDRMAKKTIGGNMQLTPADWKTVSDYAKEHIVLRDAASDLKKQLADANKEVRNLKTAYNNLFEETRLFHEAVKLSPKRIKNVMDDIFRQSEAARTAKRKNKDVER